MNLAQKGDTLEQLIGSLRRYSRLVVVFAATACGAMVWVLLLAVESPHEFVGPHQQAQAASELRMAPRGPGASHPQGERVTPSPAASPMDSLGRNMLMVGGGIVAAALAWLALRRIRAEASGARQRVEANLARQQTARRIALQKLAVYEDVLGDLAIGLAIVDLTHADTPMVFVSDAFCELTGHTRDQLLGASYVVLQGGASGKEREAEWRGILASRQATAVDVANRRPDGRVALCRVSLRPLADESGAISAMVCTHREVAEGQDQERIVTAAQKLVGLGELAGGLAHDFNNLLGAVTGSCDLLAQHVSHSPEAMRHVDAIRLATRGGAAQARRLMDLTRLPAREVKAVDLSTVGEDLWHLLAREVQQGLRIILDIAASARWVLGDASQLQGVLLNLLLNAREAMPGGGLATVRSRRVVIDGEAWVIVTVSDQGRGMDDATLGRLFQPFFTTRASKGGHGLGLAMVRAYVDGIGGKISVSSVVGQGTRFDLQLRPSAPTDEDEPVTGLSGTTADGGQGRALLVDDDKTLRLVTRTMLETLGYEVTDCGNADEALGLLHAGDVRFDVLVTDNQLGSGPSGVELAEAVRRSSPLTGLVVASGNRPSGAAAAAADRAWVFLPKPYSLGELDASVRSARDRPVFVG